MILAPSRYWIVSFLWLCYKVWCRKREGFAMPNWIGQVGLIAMLIFCGSFLAQIPLLAMVFLVVGLAMAVLENKYEQGTTGG
jgi:uncharacterized metal-binding protein